MTKSEKLVQFYSECQAKGYTDMTDATQSLKAKVIASDLMLPYGKIVELYAAAKKEFEADQKKKTLKAQAAAAEAERLSKPGEKIMVLYGTVEGNDRIVDVFRREDKSIYCTCGGAAKIEGLKISVEKGGVLSYNYHPSQTVYTGASAGGIHMGGFHETKAYVSQGYSSSGKGNIVAVFGSNTMKLDEVEVSDNVQTAFKRDESFQSLVDEDGTITCIDSKGYDSARFMVTSALRSSADIYTKQNMLSQAADMKRLPMETCKAIADLLNRIINNHCPPSDEDYYKKAEELFQEGSLQSLSDSIKLFNLVSDYKDSAKRAAAAGERFEELQQQAKEQAILNEEKFKKAVKKSMVVIIPILVAIVVVMVLTKTVFIPMAKYNTAVRLYKKGQYIDAMAAFEAMDGYKDSAERIKLCEEGITDEAYSEAKKLLESGAFDDAKTAFEALNGYKDSEEMIEQCKNGKKEIKYAEAKELFESGSFEKALWAFRSVNDYKDSKEYIKKCENKIKDEAYVRAKRLYNSGKLNEARKAFMELNGYKDSEKMIAAIFSKAKVGSVIQFGSYEQDNVSSNGKEDIDWLVLSRENNRMLLISQYALIGRPYNSVDTDVTWETCSLRQWLNGEFISGAFSTSEQKMIMTTNIVNEDNPNSGASGGNNTKDKVFLLSMGEAKQFFDSDKTRKCMVTVYAEQHGVYTVGPDYIYCWWWLRTPGFRSDDASFVFSDGSINDFQNDINLSHFAVRPAMWVSIE